jgi:hyaluronoglucosaminidase
MDPRTHLPQPVPAADDSRPAGKSSRFAVRGIKGWAWSPEQYLDIIPWLPTVRFNFLMNCYASMCHIEDRPWGTPGCNRWWEPLPDWKVRAFEGVVAACRGAGVDFCFSMNPNLFSSRFARPDRPADVDALWGHYAWMQGLGVRWFNVSLDDVGQGIDATAQSWLVNELLRRLRWSDPGARMIFCPTIYWGDASRPSDRRYLDAVAQELEPAVLVFWAGDAVVTPRITRRAAESFRSTVGHRLVIWDNYPVNADQPTMHLGPLSGRDPDLPEAAEGYMANPMRRQNRLNRLALATCADYAWDSRSYDSARSIRDAIQALWENAEQRAVLDELVEAYPGMLTFGQNQYFNPVRDRFSRLLDASPEKASDFARGIDGMSRRFRAAFSRGYAAERATVEDDVAWMRRQLPAEGSP